jgi:hypothetical protein
MSQEEYVSTNDKAFGEAILRLMKENNRLLTENNALQKENNAILIENNRMLKQNQVIVSGIEENVRKIKMNTN